jgi:methylenetetrahydrofolate dehydrogenase (NADP+)/methenyltetrahydrofolate cyclohydrolase
MAKIINGRKIADEFCEQIRERVQEIKANGTTPCVALINASDDPASEIYISKKKKLAESVGISSMVYRFDDRVKESELADLIKKLNESNSVHAILLQAPLPKSIRFRELVNLIHPDKDVDGLTTLNQGRLFSGEPGVIPCTPLGVLHLLRTVHDRLAGLHAVVIGRSSIVGRPLSQLLLNANCTVTSLHSYSQDLASICRTADILVSAVGKPHFVEHDFVKPGATVIDVGVNRIEENGMKKIVGDVDFDNVSEVAGAITQVPNGVGPMTVAYLMHNTLKLACCY